MSDLIKREDAIEMVHAFFGAEIDRELPVLDSDEYILTPDEMKRLNMLLGYNKRICIRLKVIPPEDAVPVVRCKDCKYWGETLSKEEREAPGADLVCSYWMILEGLTAEDFCSSAERRGDE